MNNIDNQTSRQIILQLSKQLTESLDGENIGAESCYTFSNVTANHTIHATFKSSGSGTKYLISASAGANGKITPSGDIEVSEGSKPSS